MKIKSYRFYRFQGRFFLATAPLFAVVGAIGAAFIAGAIFLAVAPEPYLASLKQPGDFLLLAPPRKEAIKVLGSLFLAAFPSILFARSVSDLASAIADEGRESLFHADFIQAGEEEKADS